VIVVHEAGEICKNVEKCMTVYPEGIVASRKCVHKTKDSFFTNGRRIKGLIDSDQKR